MCLKSKKDQKDNKNEWNRYIYYLTDKWEEKKIIKEN